MQIPKFHDNAFCHPRFNYRMCYEITHNARSLQMKKHTNAVTHLMVGLVSLLFFLTALAPCTVHASFSIKVTANTVSKNPATQQVVTTGSTPVHDFKWVVQQDNTTDSVGNAGLYNNYSSLSVTIHKSHAKVLASGTSANPVVNLPPGRYFVSVMVPNGYSVGGGPVRPEDDGKAVNIIVNKYPIPLSQITVLVFQDNAPINGAPDLPAEGPIDGFRVYMFDQLGQQSQDAFGNPIGTIYESDANGVPILYTDNTFSQPVATGSAGIPKVVTLGPGYVLSTPNMEPNFNWNARIPNLAPGKYGIWVQPADGRPWVQTSTIEGTPGIDTWIVAGEPDYFTANNTFGTHADLGFILESDYYGNDPGHPAMSQSGNAPAAIPAFSFPPPGTSYANNMITGQVVQNRIFRPPLQMGLNPGDPVPNAYVGLSDNLNANQAVFVMGCPGQVTHGPSAGSTCDEFSRFTIVGVPPGTYTLTMWDLPLDQIIDYRTVVMPATGGTVPVENCLNTDPNYPYCPSPIFQWFGTLEGSVSVPTYANGQPTTTMPGLPNELINIRFRDGTLYASTTANPDGTYSFTEVFPFYHWLVVESDPGDNKPMGATVYVDKAGPFVGTWSPTGNNTIPLLEQRTDPPGTNSHAALMYMDNTNRIDYYKREYTKNETGYIWGFVSYAFTRTPYDPSLSVASVWEPGVPNVEVRLYQVDATQGVSGYDPVTGKPILVKDANGNPKAIAHVLTDSWDESFPTGCLDAMKNPKTPPAIDINAGGIPLDKYIDCSETLPIWNQIKPGVFDGAYRIEVDDQGNPLKPGDYVVEVVPPTGYEIYKEEDENFTVSGVNPPNIIPSLPQPPHPASFNSAMAKKFHTLWNTKKPKPAVPPPACVGPDHTVPAFMSFDGVTPSPMAGQVRPLCTMKLVNMQPGQNFNVDFRIFTQVPIAARLIGLVTDDLAMEFRAGNPRLGDKPGPSFMPVSIQDFAGNELVRGYTDEWGQYNMLVPSTYWTDTPNPTGVSPHMVNIILNPPYMADPVTRQIDPRRPEPFWKPGYPSNQPFPMDLWPGKITYADTPMVPIRPQVDALTVDCTIPDATPTISEVNGPAGGPWVETPSANSLIAINSAGQTEVANPDPTAAVKKLIKNYGFGQSGDVFVTPTGDDFGGSSTKKLQVISWTDTQIVVSAVTLRDDGTPDAPLPTGPTAPTSYQLTVMRGDNHKIGVTGVTLHVGIPATKVHVVSPDPSGNTTPIQNAIDTAQNGDLILVKPGFYPENVIMWKPIRLQGAGAPSTTIAAGYFTPNKQNDWLAKINTITGNQVIPSPWLIDAQQPDFFLESGSAVLVLAPNAATPVTMNGTTYTVNPFDNGANKAMIDGFTMTQASLGGGIYVDNNAHYIQVSNNKVVNNNGTFGGGVRIGTPTAISNNAPNVYEPAFNDHVRIVNNEISFNGGTGFTIGSGGGIGLYKGADDYVVSDNWICGNYATLAGAGITHQGLSCGGFEVDPVTHLPVFDPTNGNLPVKQQCRIMRNTILVNEAFDEGGGIVLTGENPIAAGAGAAGVLSEGVGNVVVADNLIQANKGGNSGGGIALLRYNGQDVAANPTNASPAAFATAPTPWYKAEFYNNMIVNNLSGAFGGGIAITDAVDVTIASNTIVNNDSTATGEVAFGNSTINLDGADAAFTLPSTRQTTPVPAGIGLQALSTALVSPPYGIDPTIVGNYLNTYVTNPVIVNNIIYGNMSYYWPGFDQNVNAGVATLTPFGIWDLGVFTDPKGAAGTLNPQYTLLTAKSPTYPLVKNNYTYPGAGIVQGDVSHDPQLVKPYRNTISATQGGATLGNFVAFTYTPMALTGNYHILATSAARKVGTPGGTGILNWNHQYLDLDIDGDTRAVPVDIGADQYNGKGDVNGDNTVNILDVLVALQMATGIYPVANVTPDMLTNVHVAPLSITGRPASGPATYNPPASNSVSVADALLILQRAIGVIFW